MAFDTRKALALLAVLALADRPRPRDVLAELLWPEHDAEHARGALRRTLSALRCGVGAGRRGRDARPGQPRARRRGSTVDVDSLPRGWPPPATWRGGRGVFRGEFLEGFGLRDAPGFEDWQRERGGRRCGASSRRVLARLVEATGRRGGGAALARARPAARAGAPRADPALRGARRPRGGARPVPRVRADAVARARCSAARGDDAALRGDQRRDAGDAGDAGPGAPAPAAPPPARAAGRPRPRVGGAARRLRRHRPRRRRGAAGGRGRDRQDAAGRGARRVRARAGRRRARRPRLRGGGRARVRAAGRGAAAAAARRRRVGRAASATARCARRRGCCPTSAPPLPRRSTGRLRRRGSSTACGRRSPPPRPGRSRACW